MTSQIGLYDYNQTFYTGTNIQPDVLSIFIKPGKESKNFLGYSTAPLANWMGIFPVVSIFSGLARVINAAKVAFKNLSDLTNSEKTIKKSELWEALKNIFRGIVEIIPFTGIILIIFDSIRNAIYLEKIQNELKNKKNIAGVAIDGKVIITIDLEKLDYEIKNFRSDSKKNEYLLKRFTTIWLTYLNKAEKKHHTKIGMNELFSNFSEDTIKGILI